MSEPPIAGLLRRPKVMADTNLTSNAPPSVTAPDSDPADLDGLVAQFVSPVDPAADDTDQPEGRSATRARRGFLMTAFLAVAGSPLAIGFTTLASALLCWLFGSLRFLFPNVLIEPPSRFKVGRPEELGAGQVDSRHTAQHGIWIVHHVCDGMAQIYALKAVCTHLGCTPVWLEAEQKFKCPCHGSGFRKDGTNFEGPAPRPLERFAIRIADDGQLEVDKSLTFQHERGQWRDPRSFVRA